VVALVAQTNSFNSVVPVKPLETCFQEETLPDPNLQPTQQYLQDFQDKPDSGLPLSAMKPTTVSDVHEHAILKDGSHGVLQGNRKAWVNCEDEPIRYVDSQFGVPSVICSNVFCDIRSQILC
jgi:hypothetical protein